MKVLVTGADGLVGRAMIKHCTDAGDQTVSLDHARLDIADQRAIDATFDRERPDVVINCAAWTDVDACESHPGRAQTVNAHGPEFLALACQRLSSLFVTISTDYVFDGEKNGFYTQRDQPNPQSAYARSKLEGEHLAQISWARTIVVRSGYIFGVGGRNFLSSVIDQVRRGERVLALNDTFGTPTYAPDLARQLYELARLDLPGIYHVVNTGAGMSFEAFVRRAVEIAGLDTDLVQGISHDTLKRVAPRPRNSRLRCLLSEAIGLVPLPSCEDALKRFVVAGSRSSGAMASSPTT
ncbi:MAG TPA: dTDP-4-dehydrorhamnose reductase [Pyrinomonadaceae bacterium]|nr:dTDP-4-dehydrorhamnose reductase [Pyrinomonadaceae bacterium]